MLSAVHRSDWNDGRKLRALVRQHYTLLLWIWLIIGVLIISGAIIYKSSTSDSKDKLLIFQLGQSLPIQALGSDSLNGVAKTKALADQMTRFLSNSTDTNIFPDIIRDVGIAVFISAFVTMFIERSASDQLHASIASDVLEAAYAKVIPEKIYRQIADTVFKSDVYRRNWTVHIEPSAEDNVQRHLQRATRVIRATYSYNVENLNEQEMSFPVIASIDIDDPPPDPTANLPRFRLFEVKDEHDRVLSDVSMAENELLNINLDKPSRIRDVVLSRADQRILLTGHVIIPGRRSIKVSFEVEREIRVPGNYVLTTGSPADGITIVISRAIKFKLDVVPLHPNLKALHHSPGSNTWQFEAGILPWQGVRFVSEPVAPPITPPAASAAGPSAALAADPFANYNYGIELDAPVTRSAALAAS